MEEPTAAGSWRKVSILGSGGFGVVALWQNRDTNEFIAVKKCRWEDPSRITERQRGRWTKEVEMMRSIRHDNIVAFRALPPDLAKFLDRYNPSLLPLLSMEYCTRGNLRRYLSQPRNVCGLPETEVRYFLRDISSAISHLHSLNVTHRDVKPENVVLDACDARSTGVVYKLIDLGYAKELDAEVASFVGTLQYLAPEMFERKAYGPNVDYWSFGVVAFEVICGVHPFMADISPVQRYEYLKKKSPDDICIFRSEKGGVRYSTELLPEHHLNPRLKTRLESWLRLMLRFDPATRGLTNDVFAVLDSILRTNVVCVFSVYNYRYYHFEVGEADKFETLQRRIEEESGVKVEEQLLLTDNVFYEEDGERRVFECMEEISAVLVLFKKSSPDPIFDKTAALPPYVKHVLSVLHESDPAKLRHYTAHCVHYVRLETKLMRSLKVALSAQSDYVTGFFRRESVTYEELLSDVRKMLGDVEAHGERLRQHGDASTADRMRESKRTLWRAREIVENVNAVTCRRAKMVGREALLDVSKRKLDEELGTVNPDEIYENALACLKKATPTLADIRKVLMDMLKRRYELLNNRQIVDYLAASFKALRELRRLMRWTEALRRQTLQVAAELRRLDAEMLTDQQQRPTGKSARIPCQTTDVPAQQVMHENVELRYSFHEAFNTILATYRRYFDDENSVETSV